MIELIAFGVFVLSLVGLNFFLFKVVLDEHRKERAELLAMLKKLTAVAAAKDLEAYHSITQGMDVMKAAPQSINPDMAYMAE